jgi:hypothetical protein
MTRKIPWLLAAVLSAGCASAPPAQTASPASSAPPLVLAAQACPTALPEVSVIATDTQAGVALDFRTTGELEALRDRVHRLARAQNEWNQRGREQLAREATRRTIARALPPGVDSQDVFKPSGPGAQYGATQGMASEGPDLGAADDGEPEVGLVIPSHALVVPTADGARLVLVPESAENLDQLRTVVRSRAPLLRSGRCPLLA